MKQEMINKVVKLLEQDNINRPEIMATILRYELSELEVREQEPFENKVKRALGISGANLANGCTKNEYVTARFFMFLYYRSEKLSLQSIADKYGLKTHSTVIHGLRNFKNFYNQGDKVIMHYISKDKSIMTPEMIKQIELIN